MRIWVNGKEHEFENICTLKDILRAIKYEEEFFAVALNMNCIPRHQYEHTILKENDSIEILSPMQGG